MLTMLLCWPPLVAQAQGQGLCDDDAYYADDMSGVIIDRHGKSILYLFGGFGENAANNVRNQIRRTRDYDEVWMCSSGGFVNQGMAIGRQLNAVKATVRVPRGFRCVSSCTIAFMGGFVRIVEPESQYIVHASSAFLNLSISDTDSLDCREPGASKICGLILSTYNQPEHQCDTVSELQDPDADCLVIDAARGSNQKSLIGYRTRALYQMPPSPDLLQYLSDRMTQRQIDSTIELLQYYQEMLLSGQSRHIRQNAYSSLRSQFRPLRLYDPANFGQDARFLADDVRAINNANLVDRVSIWQSVFTDTELNVKRQLVEYIKESGLSLGPAGTDAVKILEAMVICQIQTQCRLQPAEAAALGVHNVFDAE